MDNRQKIASRIMVALDVPRAEQAERLLDQLYGIPCYMKVGMELFYASGGEWVRSLKKRGYRVFLDLKLHDIPNTVQGAAANITRLGVDMFNVHVAGGVDMMRAAVAGASAALAEQPDLQKPMIIGVTQLTSTSQTVLNEEIGIPGPIDQAVLRYAALAQSAGLNGVVASPWEVQKIKESCGPEFVTVTPGIRPAGSQLGDQSRVMTPARAFAQGTDFIVIGRPITQAADPRRALEAILDSIRSQDE